MHSQVQYIIFSLGLASLLVWCCRRTTWWKKNKH